MVISELPAKDPSEILVIDFNFASELGTNETVESAVVTVRTHRGYDLSPSAILATACQLQPGLVLQQIGAGVDGTTYYLKCVATTSAGRALVRKTLLPVIA